MLPNRAIFIAERGHERCFDFCARVPRKPYNGMQPRAGSGVGR